VAGPSAATPRQGRPLSPTDVQVTDTRTHATPLTIVFIDQHDRYNGRGILRSHLAEYVQEFDAESHNPPGTLCGYPLSDSAYRYAPSRQSEAFARCDACARIYNKTRDRRTPQFLGKPTRRQPPKLDTYTVDGRHAQSQRATLQREFKRDKLPIPSTLTPYDDDAAKREHTRRVWIRRARYENDLRRNAAHSAHIARAYGARILYAH
jgi:hypothetical protein